MKNKVTWLGLSFLIATAMVLASCTKSTTTTSTTSTTTTTTSTTSTTKTSTTPTTTPTTTTTPALTEKPQYGGKFIYRTTIDPIMWDSLFYNQSVGATGQYAIGLWYETLGTPDVSIDRNIYDFKTSYIPLKYEAGRIAESWEIGPDWTSYTFHIRKGVHWQDIPPMNGRELTADDIAWNYNRDLGLGGFPPAPYFPKGSYNLIASVTATDKYTVVFKMSTPSMTMLTQLLDTISSNYIMPREAVEKWGDVQDSKRQIGTGPFILKDYVPGSSITAIRNPNYYRFDPKYPENRLPYIDEVKVLNIPDLATALAALRTGKIDLIEAIDWQKAADIKKSNPELMQVTSPNIGPSLTMRLDLKPFDDIRVRQAIQMAIDLDSIAKNYLGGTVPGTPTGTVGTKGYYVPFAEWPQQLKDTYLYNPAGAKKLLADAGYPSGFNTSIVIPTSEDFNLFQIVKSYLNDVSINMAIQVMDNASWTSYVIGNSKHEMCSYYGWQGLFPVIPALNDFYSKHSRTKANHLNDPGFDAIYNQAQASLDPNEFMGLIKQADMYAITKQWQVNLLPRVSSNIYSPWLHGYQGEDRMLYGLSPYLWIDQDLKKAMGR